MENLKLNQTESEKWLKNLIIFLSPVGIIYLIAVVDLIQANNGAVRAEDFIPNEFVVGGMTLYLLNSVLDYLRKITNN